jgi:predicted O-methyltransferase YrrM
MMRWDVINSFIEKNKYKSYLELGYYKGWSFDQVKCEEKTAVDPNPSKVASMQVIDYGSNWYDKGNIIHKLTSDDFFDRLERQERTTKRTRAWDIVFIDGLHEAKQVEKDIQNALKHLSPKGTIVLHDCNPPKYEHTTTGIDGCWTGDVYKTAVRCAADYDYDFYTIDTDWGVGVLKPITGGMHVNGRIGVEGYINNWEKFDENRQWLLNLISVEEFKTKMNEGTTDTNSATFRFVL